MRLFSANPHLLLFLIPALLLLAGCLEPVEEGPAPEEEFLEPLYFEPVGLGQQARLSDTLEVAIRDPETWARYRELLRPLGPFKEVDFSQTMVLLAGQPAPAGGYQIAFESVEKADSTIMASYVVGVPDDDCVTVMAQSFPFQAVMVRRAEGEVVFRHRTETLPCELP